jgi:hypothetical protein
LFDGATKVSGKMTIIFNPKIKICMFVERNGHQTGNISAMHGYISLNGPNVHVLLGNVDIFAQIDDERLH